jgi:hypothetical protein
MPKPTEMLLNWKRRCFVWSIAIIVVSVGLNLILVAWLSWKFYNPGQIWDQGGPKIYNFDDWTSEVIKALYQTRPENRGGDFVEIRRAFSPQGWAEVEIANGPNTTSGQKTSRTKCIVRELAPPEMIRKIKADTTFQLKGSIRQDCTLLLNEELKSSAIDYKIVVAWNYLDGLHGFLAENFEARAVSIENAVVRD